jgi:arylsulfatase A-like enzyme
MSPRPSRRRRWRWLTVGMLVAAGVGSGCRRPAATGAAIDLAAAGPASVVTTETAKIDIGTPQARSHLGPGWYYDERNRSTGGTFAWSRGRSSEIVFHLGWRRDLTMTARCRAFQFPGAPMQTVSFELNGRPLGGAVVLEPSTNEIRVDLPAADQIVGRNRLVARYGRVDAPAAVSDGATDERELAVAWSELEFTGVDEEPLRRSTEAIELPAGARVDSFLDIPPDSTLRIDRCVSLGDTSVELEVSILGDGAVQPEVVSWTCSGGPYTHHLESRGGLKRIRLSTHPVSPDDAPTGIRLHNPRIVTPAPGPEVAEERLDAEPKRRGPPPNVIVYLVDALRSDRLGVYGCDRPLSPRLDAMAAEGITFTDVVAQSSWTKAAVASIFTGEWPRAHGVNGPDDRLPDSLPTLPEMLHAAGYRTGAIVANAYVGRPFGFARGFDHFEFIEHSQGRSEVLHERAVSWLESLGAGGDPFFLYVHTIDPHAPYAPPPPYLETFASTVPDPSVGQVETVRGLVLGTVEPTPELGRDLRDLYDGEVAANDASFGRLLDELETRGELENTVIIFTSDHGEAFGEHGNWTHGLDLANEVLSIPLVLRLPGGAGAGQRVPTTVQHIDLLPTILGLCGVDPPRNLTGEQLVDRSGAVRVRDGRTIYAYLDYWGRTGASAQAGGWKLIQPMTPEFGSKTVLFDRTDDRVEEHDVAEQRPVRAGWLLARLTGALQIEGAGVAAEVDADTRAQLEALGYMH